MRKFTKELEKELQMIDIPRILSFDLFESNLEKAQTQGLDSCPCCGKAIKNARYFINSAFGGCAYLSKDKNEYDDCWVMAVGSECRKKFPEGYVFEKKDINNIKK